MNITFPPQPAVPSSVTMYQARVAIRRAGLLAEVVAAFDALPEPQRAEALDAWEFKTTVSRDSQFLIAVAAVLGLTDAQVDELFAAAAAIPPN